MGSDAGTEEIMALMCLSLPSCTETLVLFFPPPVRASFSPPSTSRRSCCSFVVSLPAFPSLSISNNRRRKSQLVRMAPEGERITHRHPLDFPPEWQRRKAGRRRDIFPNFSPMKTPLPPPMPEDVPAEDDGFAEEYEEEEEQLQEEQLEDDWIEEELQF